MVVKDLYEKLDEMIKEGKEDYDVNIEDSEFGVFDVEGVKIDDIDRSVLLIN